MEVALDMDPSDDVADPTPGEEPPADITAGCGNNKGLEGGCNSSPLPAPGVVLLLLGAVALRRRSV